MGNTIFNMQGREHSIKVIAMECTLLTIRLVLSKWQLIILFLINLGLFPVFFDNDGTFYTYTGFGDFPFPIPDRKISGPDELFPHWMLLSYKKRVEVSSELQGFPKNQAVDEDIRTYWSAKPEIKVNGSALTCRKNLS
jgi:hypothetical protein